jgi:hypothetical protein
MASLTKIYPGNSSFGKFPFPANGRYHARNTTSSGFITSNNVMNSKELNTEIVKKLIESFIYEVFIKEKTLNNERDVNSFGSIYLCDLQPDYIDKSMIEKIRKFADVRDLSDSIFFDDGMDD